MADEPYEAGLQRLIKLMDYSLAQQQLTWDEVAQRAGKGGSVAQLRAVRTGRARLSVKTKLAIERGLGWQPGTVDGILANDHLVINMVRTRGSFSGAWRRAATEPAHLIPKWSDHIEPEPEFEPQDATEAELWGLKRIPWRERLALIEEHRRLMRGTG